MTVEVVAAKVGTNLKASERAKLMGKGIPSLFSPAVNSSILVQERNIIPEIRIMSSLSPIATA